MADTSQLDIKKYWQIILRRRYLFIAVSLLCLSVIVWGSYFMPKIYEAKSTVFIEENIIKNLIKGIAITPSMEERLRVLTYAMMSRRMLLKVIDVLDLDIKAKNQEEIESMVIDFQKNTKITLKGNDLFMVSYRGREHVLVRDYVNTLVSEYIEENISSSREEVSGANKFLTEQIEYYKKKLDEAEQKLTNFRRERGIYLAMDEKSLVTSIKATSEQIEDLNIKIKELVAKKEKIKQQLSGEKPLTLAIIDSTNNENLSTQLKALEKRLLILLTKYTEDYPEVVKIKTEIEGMKKQITNKGQGQEINESKEDALEISTSIMNPVYQQLKEELFRAESDIDSLKAKIQSLTLRNKKLEMELKNIPEDKKMLFDMERERDTYAKIYNELVAKLGQAEVSEQMEVQDKGASFRVVDAAILPQRPVSPDRVKLILFGIAAGIASGFGAVLLREYLDNSIRDIDTLKSQIGLQVLAIVPQIVVEEDIKRQIKRDKRIYIATVVYLSIIGGIFIKEVLNKFQ